MNKSMNKNIYVEFTKKDLDKRIVEGFATTETEDSQGEIVKLSAIEKALPDYMKFANIREMHQMSAVGKAIGVSIDRAKKGLYISAKIVDKEAWEKVKEGVYNAFSIGGKVLKRTDNVIEEIVLKEISIVDRPANPDAVFSMVKIGDVMDSPAPELNEVELAAGILMLARELRYLLGVFEENGKSTVELSTALTNLKNIAAKVLRGEDSKKFDKILYAIDFKEIDKAKIPQIQKKQKSQSESVLKTDNISKHINVSWAPGYFEDVKKVLG